MLVGDFMLRTTLLLSVFTFGLLASTTPAPSVIDKPTLLEKGCSGASPNPCLMLDQVPVEDESSVTQVLPPVSAEEINRKALSETQVKPQVPVKEVDDRLDLFQPPLLLAYVSLAIGIAAYMALTFRHLRR